MDAKADEDHFTLSGCRQVWKLMGSSARLGRMIELLESSVPDNAGLVFDAARALSESVCKTVLRERSVEFDESIELPKLVNKTLSAIALAPDPNAEEVSAVLRQLGGGLQSTGSALAALRNKEGFVSHGKDAYWRDLDRIHAEVAARAAETLIYMVYMAHVKYPQVTEELEDRYIDHPIFNTQLDESYGPIVIEGIEFNPSELLWAGDNPAYRELVAASGIVEAKDE